MTLVSQGWTGYLTHLQEHRRYPAVKKSGKKRALSNSLLSAGTFSFYAEITDAPQPIRTHPP
jgi:hypothetical protein